MAFKAHVAEHNITAGIIGGMLFGQENGLVVNGDLTSLSNALAAVDTKQAKKHAAEATFGERVKASLRIADQYLSGYTSGTNISNITGIEDIPTKGRSLVF
jgi:hypothetical protein